LYVRPIYIDGEEPGLKVRVALVVPGGVDRSGEYRIIPALVALLGRLARMHEVQVIALAQEPEPSEWGLVGASVLNIGKPHTRRRALQAIRRMHRSARFDLIQAIWSGYPGLIAVTAGLLLRIPSCVHVAGGELVGLTDIGYGGGLTWRGRVRERLTLRLASVVTAASEPMLEAVRALGVDAQRLALGVDLAIWPPRAPVRRDLRKPARLVHVASLNRVKDQTTLLRALQRLAQTGIDFQIDIVGEDTLAGEITRLARELGLEERIQFRGFLPQRLLRPVVDAADLMIISSRHEAGPLVVLEAAVAGVPTVGTAVGHIAEWAPQAAVAVPAADPVALADAIIRMLTDEELRLRIAQEAFRRAVAEDADHTAERFDSIYCQLVNPRPREG
jgi:glycosyltransferase involved in cell wall biosynthesis